MWEFLNKPKKQPPAGSSSSSGSGSGSGFSFGSGSLPEKQNVLQSFLYSIEEDKIQDELQLQFLETLKTDEMKMKAYLIAREHLQTSFDLTRCNMFQEYTSSLKKNT